MSLIVCYIKKWKNLIILNFSILIIQLSFAQQDPQYSQYMFNQLVINPAYAGCKDAVNTTLILRNQWVGIDGAPQTQTLSAHAPIGKKKIGLGLHIISDQIGPRKNTGVFGSYAYKITLPKGKLSMGLRMGLYQYVYNWSVIDHLDQADLVYSQNRNSYLVPTADAGLYYYNNDMYTGLSVTHLLNGRIISTNISNDNASFAPHAFFTAGKAFDISSSILLNPSVVLRTTKNAPINVDINLNVLFQQRIWGGFSYRTSHGLIFIVQIIATDKLKVGYSYDWGFSKLDRLTSGAHEIMLSYDFAQLRRSSVLSPRYF